MRIRELINWLDEKNCNYSYIGDTEGEVNGFASLSNYKDGCLTWIKKQDSYNKSGRPKDITLAVVQNAIDVDFDNAIYADNSKELFFALLHHFWGNKIEIGSIGAGTIISENAKVARTVTIGCNCSIVGNISIGDNSVIENNVVIQGNVNIGKRCYIQSGTVIGIDGFGYIQDSITKKKEMIEHFGGVVIGDDVFIGSHVNIARGTIDDTVVGSGVKIAPSTHIGHNNNVGEDATIICSNLYGSVQIGSRAYITDSTVANQMKVGADTVIGMGSVVTNSIGSGVIAYGTPAVVKRNNDSGL